MDNPPLRVHFINAQSALNGGHLARLRIAIRTMA